MNQRELEQNITHSFDRAKKDIYFVYQELQKLQKEVIELKLDNKELKNVVSSFQYSETESKQIVASDKGKKVHDESCAFAKKINPLNKIAFNSVYDAAVEGYDQCSCLA